MRPEIVREWDTWVEDLDKILNSDQLATAPNLTYLDIYRRLYNRLQNKLAGIFKPTLDSLEIENETRRGKWMLFVRGAKDLLETLGTVEEPSPENLSEWSVATGELRKQWQELLDEIMKNRWNGK